MRRLIGFWRGVGWLVAVALLAGCGPAASSGGATGGGAVASPAARDAGAGTGLPSAGAVGATPRRIDGGTLTVGMVADVVTLDPPQITDVYSGYVSAQIHETLMVFDHEARLQPWLAEKVEQPDDKTFLFRLRDGVKFHNGEPLTADDVVFTWRRVLDPATKAPRAFQLGDAVASGDHITAVDRLTVKVELKGPFGPFLDRLTNNSLAILNRRAVEAAGGKYAQQPVGTGPFKYVDWRTGDRATVERFDGYWRGQAALDKIVFRPIPDANTRLIDLEAGTIDLLMDVPPAEFERLQRENKVKIQQIQAVSVTYLAYNTQKAPFVDNVKLRQALNHAIDRDELVKTVFYGVGLPSISPLNPMNWAHDPTTPQYPFDPAKAKELLQAAGGAPAGPIELAVSDQPDIRQMAERIQAQVKETLGIDLTIRVLEWGGFLSYLREGAHQMCMIGWSGAGDPDGILYPLFHSKNWGAGGNRAFYKNSRVDDLLVQAQSTANQDQRKNLYLEAQQTIMQDAPWKTLRHGVISVAHSPKVQGYQVHPLGRQVYFETWLDK